MVSSICSYCILYIVLRYLMHRFSLWICKDAIYICNRKKTGKNQWEKRLKSADTIKIVKTNRKVISIISLSPVCEWCKYTEVSLRVFFRSLHDLMLSGKCQRIRLVTQLVSGSLRFWFSKTSVFVMLSHVIY